MDRRDAPGALREAAHVINVVVRRLAERLDKDLAPRDRPCNGGWAASYALANHYADGQEAVGAHAGGNSPFCIPYLPLRNTWLPSWQQDL